jgi:hypothetical protein
MLAFAARAAAAALLPVHRAVSAVLKVMLVAYVTRSTRVQHGLLRSKHWFALAAWTMAAYAVVGPCKWIWATTDKWIW